MTQNQPDRLDRIEATLERVSQQLDNQVVVNAELRQSTAELRQSTAELRQSTTELWQSTTELRQSIEELRQTADELIHSVSALVQTANIHQQGLEILTREVREQRTEIRELQEFQPTASAALDRITIVLDYLVRREQ